MSNFSLESIEVALKPLERFEEFLQSKGKRVTQQRRLLVQHVFKRHEHFDADDLIDEVSRLKEAGRVSRPTIYRTLRELVDAGLLRQMTIGGRSVYEHDYGYPQHDHLHCEKCNQLIEFQSPELKTQLEAVAESHGFRVSGHRLIVNGVCANCARRPRRRKRPLDRI